MIFHRREFLFCLSLAAFVASPVALAGSAPEDQAFQKRIFGRTLETAGGHACFSRVYDAGHLAAHPHQNVRTMLLLVTGGAGNDADAPAYQLGLGVTFRKSGVHFETSGDCGALHDAAAPGAAKAVAHCGVDCDGGSIDVSLKDTGSVLVSIPDGARIAQAGSNDDPPSGEDRKRFGSDDRLFRLDRTTLTNCLSLAVDDKDKAAMRKGQ